MRLRIERSEDKAVIVIESAVVPESIVFVKAGCTNKNYAELLVRQFNKEYAQMLRNEFCRGRHFASKFKSKVQKALTWLRGDYHPDKLLEVICNHLKHTEVQTKQHWEDLTILRRRVKQLIAELRAAGVDVPRPKKVKK